MVDTIAETSGTTYKFDAEKYFSESDASIRFQMAAEFIKKDEASWIFTYGSVADKLDTVGQVVDRAVDQRIENKEKAVSKTPEPIRRLEEFVDNKSFLAYLVKEGKLTQEQADMSLNNIWGSVIDSFNLEQPVSQPVKETLDWLKRKADTDNLIIVDSSNIPEEDAELKQQTKQMAKSISSDFALGGLSKLNPQAEDVLVIVAELMDDEYTPETILLSLAHERGHEILNKQAKDPGISDETFIVFEEFFPMMEAQRIYDSYSDAQKGKVRPSKKADYEKPPDFDQKVYETKIPGMSTPIQLTASEGTWQLWKAYVHSLETKQRYQKYKLATEMLSQNAPPEQVRDELSKIKLLTKSVVDARLQWNLVN